MHVVHDRKVAKVWLDPIALEHNRGYTRVEVSRILSLAVQHRDLLLGVWNDYFAD